MTTNSFVQVPPDSTGKKLHTVQHTVDAAAVQVQAMHIVDHDNATYGQKVDVRGQANVRFAEGSPSMDAFGNLRTGEASVLGAYDYSHGDSADLFQDAVAVGGAINYVEARSATELVTTSSTNSKAVRTTVRYHHYQPGVSNLIIQTLAMSAAQAGNRRRWGYFDANDGIFWELDGEILYAVIRSSVSGSVVDTRVAQSGFNQDTLDGLGISEFDLDVTKANLYFIDYAWLGVGEVRFGVLGYNGERNMCHIFRNPNSLPDAYMKSGCQPLRWENENTDSVVGGSTLKLLCAAVYCQSRVDYTFWRFSDIERATPVTVTTDTPILSMRVKTGDHIGIYPEGINVIVTGGNVKIAIIDDTTLTNATWAISCAGAAEGDIAATAIDGGERFYSQYVPAGVTHIDLSRYYETNDEGYHRFPDDSGSYTFTLVATKLDGTTVTVGANLNYRELR